MRSVVSVSMPPELATELKIESQKVGLTFSAYVCELVTRGRIPRSLSTNHGGSGGGSGSFVEVLKPPIEELFRKTTEETVEPTGTPAERVYSAISTEKKSVDDIAEQAGLSTEDALNEIDALINGEVSEPIMVKSIAGEWFCWRVDEG